MTFFTASDDPLDVTLLILPGSSIMSVASTLDPMRAANRIARDEVFRWTIETLDGAPANLSCDLPLAAQRCFGKTSKGDILIVVAGHDTESHANRRDIAVLAQAARNHRAVGSVEAGSWLLARAGLLTDKRATTHWEDLEDFAATHPNIDVIPDRYVIDGRVFTTGGASPTFDLMLHLIRKRRGVGFAMEVASLFIYDEAHMPTDAQSLVSLGHLTTMEPRVAEAVRIMEAHIDEPIGIQDLADRLGLSARMLEKLFTETLQTPPGKYYRSLRLQVARRLTLETKLSIQEIAVRTGFNSLSALSRAFKKQFGHSPQAARK
jgi:transcriptional regulator GlxA family with amidase domain